MILYACCSSGPPPEGRPQKRKERRGKDVRCGPGGSSLFKGSCLLRERHGDQMMTQSLQAVAEYLLSVCYTRSTILDTKETTVNKTDESIILCNLCFSVVLESSLSLFSPLSEVYCFSFNLCMVYMVYKNVNFVVFYIRCSFIL